MKEDKKNIKLIHIPADVAKPSRRYKILTRIAVVILLVISVLLSLGWFHDHQLLAETQASLNNAKEVSGNLRSRIASISEEKLDAVDTVNFWQERMVLVTSEGNRYHNYGCFHLRDSELTIYSISEAKALGYEPCLDCKPAESEPSKLVPTN